VKDYSWQITCSQPAAVRMISNGLSCSLISIVFHFIYAYEKLILSYQLY